MSRPVTLRPEVARFAQLMERVLRDNDHKGGWKDMEAADLLKRLRDETKELAQAIESQAVRCGCRSADECRHGLFAAGSTDIVREAVDVANFAMMVADVFSMDIDCDH